MSVTQAQYEQVRRRREVYFGTDAGKEALQSLLFRTGVFDAPWKPGSTLEGLFFGLSLLWELGVLHPENQRLLIDAMAGLPMPTIQERNDDGGT